MSFTSITRGTKILYKPQPKQLLLHNAEAEEVLYGGAAGGGKSHALLWDAYVKCYNNPGIRAIMFRRTYPELEKSLIFRSRGFFSKDMGEYTESKKRWLIQSKDPSQPSYIEFGHCKDENDVFTYQSAEYELIYFDELTHFTEFQYLYLKSRLRTTKRFKCQMISATNPGNIGHAWVCKRWRLHEPDSYNKMWKPQSTEEELNPGTRHFIPASVYDNKVLMDLDPAYISRLESLPVQERKQLLYGDWTIFAGQGFPEWSNGHLTKSFNIPTWWSRWVSIDFGYTAPLAVYWHAQDPNSKRVYTYRELYATKVKDIEQAILILNMSLYPDGTKEKISYVVADPSIWNKHGGGISVAEVYAQNGLVCIPGNNDRIQGKIRLHSYLADAPDGKPWWIIFSDKCPNLVRTFPSLVLDRTRMEDINTKQEDHAYDSCRYFFMSLPSANVYVTGDEKIFTKDPTSIREWQSVKKMFIKLGQEKDDGDVNSINGVNA